MTFEKSPVMLPAPAMTLVEPMAGSEPPSNTAVAEKARMEKEMQDMQRQLQVRCYT